VIAPVAHAQRLDRLLTAFRRRFGRPAEGVAEAPGRVNLIGEHLDYNQGCVLPVAIDRTVLVAFARRDDLTVRVHSLDFAEDAEFAAGAAARDCERPWSNYARAVIWALASAGHPLGGLDLVVQGDVPIGAGLSSSAALEIALLGACREAWGLNIPAQELALLGQRAENEFVGVQCGIMDQFAATLAVAGHALLIDCRSLAAEAIPLPLAERGVALVVGDTASPRRLETSEYNRRREECGLAAAYFARIFRGRTKALRDVTVEEVQAMGVGLPDELFRRARHVVTEQARVERAVALLRAGDLEGVGALLPESHASLRDDFQVSSPELDLLVDLALAVPGVLGARMTGAGFGGCTVNLVRGDALADFEQRVMVPYRARTGLPGRMYVTGAHGGLRAWRAG